MLDYHDPASWDDSAPTTGIPMDAVASSCPECSDGEGKVSAKFLAEASCVFGCGRGIPWDGINTNWCYYCEDRSHNEIPCATCGFTYTDANHGQWAKEWTR